MLAGRSVKWPLVARDVGSEIPVLGSETSFLFFLFTEIQSSEPGGGDWFRALCRFASKPWHNFQIIRERTFWSQAVWAIIFVTKSFVVPNR